MSGTVFFTPGVEGARVRRKNRSRSFQIVRSEQLKKSRDDGTRGEAASSNDKRTELNGWVGEEEICEAEAETSLSDRRKSNSR